MAKKHGFDRLALERDPAEVLSTPSMVPAYVNFRPSTLICLVVGGMALTLAAGTAYDAVFWSEGASNKLIYTPAEGETSPVYGGEHVVTFGNATHPMDPYMRWLRASLVVYVKMAPECAEAAINPEAIIPRYCTEHVPRHILVSSTVRARDDPTEQWEEIGRSDEDVQRIECLDHAKASTSKHVGWPAQGLDPLSLGRRAHCYVLSLAYEDGLSHKFYEATVSIAPEPGSLELSEWVQELVVVQTHGTHMHGLAELGLRVCALVWSIITFTLYSTLMRKHRWSEWLPQQFGVFMFCLCISGYNNPAYIIFMPLGISYNVLAAVFDIAFYSAGMLLATVLADPAREKMGSLPSGYWAPRVLITAPMFVLSTAQYWLSAQHMRADPSFMYELTGGFLVLAVFEVFLFSVWSFYVVSLITFQLRSHEARMRTNKKELAFAAITTLVVGAIWLRESITFKVYTKDFMSDARFEYRARTVIMTNVFAYLVALCYAPSSMTESLASSGGVDGMLRSIYQKLEGSDEARPPAEPQSAVEALRQYVLNLRRAHRDGLSSFSAPELRAHNALRDSLHQMPQTRAYATQMAWVYPTLGFQSRQPYLWAIVLHDLDDPVSRSVVGMREKRRSVHFDADVANRASLAAIEEGAQAKAAAKAQMDDSPGVAAAKDFLLHIKAKTRLRASLHRAPLGGASDGYAFVILISNCDAVQEEHVRNYGARLMVEATLDTELPPATPADRISCIARLLTEHAGDEHMMLGQVSWRTDGIELVRASFPLHDRQFNKQVDKEWGLAPEISEAHLRVIRDHYGEELAWYFGLSDFTVEWLFPVAAFGFVLEMIKLGGDIVFYEMMWVTFGSMLVVWGAFFVAFWKRRTAELRWDWSVDSLLESTRRNPRFKGEWVADHETGTPKPVVSTWSRVPAFANTAFQMVLQVLLLCCIEYFSYGQFVWACEQFDGVPGYEYMFLFQTVIVNTIIYVGLIMFGQYILWAKIANWATTKENWPYEVQHETRYVYYLFIFIWLDGYFWSWFFGYVHVPLVDLGVDLRTWSFPIFGKLITHERTADYWMHKHDAMVASMLGMNQIAAFLFENVWPLLLVRAIRRRASSRRASTVTTATGEEAVAVEPSAQSDDRKLSLAAQMAEQIAARERARVKQEMKAVQTIVPMLGGTVSLALNPNAASPEEVAATVIQALDELQLPEYTTQDDYYDVVLFIGYIVTYTIQWPLTPVVCYLNNNLELRSDLVKINNAFRRMVPKKQRGIGAWENCIVFSVWAAIPMVVTFATISARTAEIFFLASEDPEYANHSIYWNEDGHVRWWWRILVCFIWEHLLGLICLAITIVVPKQPQWVRQAAAAARFQLAKEAHAESIERISGNRSAAADSPRSGDRGSAADQARRDQPRVSPAQWLSARRRKLKVRTPS